MKNNADYGLSFVNTGQRAVKRGVGLLIAIMVAFAALSGFAYAEGSEDTPTAPNADYASKISNKVQYLALSVNGASDGGIVVQSEEPEIYYTTDGSVPEIGVSGTKRYNGSIKIGKSMTVRYCSYLNGKKSAVKKIDFVYLNPVTIKEIYCTDGKTSKITMKWKRNYSASGYRVYRKKKGDSSWKKMTTVKDVAKNKYVDSSVKKNATYIYYVASYKGSTESLKTDVQQTIKAKHSHSYALVSVDCAAGVRTYKCSTCSEAKKEYFTKNTHETTKSKSGYYTIETCKWCGKVVKKYLTTSIPTYWSSNIVSALNTAKGRGDLPGYVFVTDPHWSMNKKHSPAIVSYVTKQMHYPFAVCGGDVIATYHDQKSDAVDEIRSFYEKFSVPVLSVAGNHDYNDNCNDNTASYLSSADIDTLIHSHNPAGTQMSHDGDFGFYDDDENQIRYITFYYDETAAVPDSIINAIDSRVRELDEDWTVILYSHAYWHYKRPGYEPEPKNIGVKLAKKLLNIQRRSDATIALWHVGHIHRDKHEMLVDTDGTQLLVVASNCDTYSKSAPWGGLEMPAGTNKEQVVEIVQVDKDAKKIYMTRIGAGASRTFDYSQRRRAVTAAMTAPDAVANDEPDLEPESVPDDAVVNDEVDEVDADESELAETEDESDTEADADADEQTDGDEAYDDGSSSEPDADEVLDEDGDPTGVVEYDG